MLEGPIPLRVAGKATFGILWWDYTVSFDKTLIGGERVRRHRDHRRRRPSCSPGSATRGSWRTELPAAATPGGRRPERAAHRRAAAAPAGSARRAAGARPAEHRRARSTGSARFVPRDARRFALTEPRIGGATPSVAPVSDEFPDSQFFEMSDAERLAAPGVVIREAGVSFGNDRYASDAAAGVAGAVPLHRDRRRAGRRARRAARPREPRSPGTCGPACGSPRPRGRRRAPPSPSATPGWTGRTPRAWPGW